MNPSLPHLKQKGSPSLKPACLSKTKLNPLLSFPLFLKNQKKKKKRKLSHWSDGYPKTTTLRPFVTHSAPSARSSSPHPICIHPISFLFLFTHPTARSWRVSLAFITLVLSLLALFSGFSSPSQHSLLISSYSTYHILFSPRNTQTNNKSLSSFTTVSDHHPVLFHRSRSPLLSSPSDYGYLFHLHSHHHHHQQHKHHELSFNHHQHHCCCCFIYTINAVLSVLFSTSWWNSNPDAIPIRISFGASAGRSARPGIHIPFVSFRNWHEFFTAAFGTRWATAREKACGCLDNQGCEM